MHKVNFTLAAAVALATTSIAHAQNPAEEAAAEASSSSAPEEILVTAQRRSERLVDVPLSISAVSEETLQRAGVTNTGDLARVVPGLSMPLNGGFVQPAIRGISSSGSNPADSSNVAIYIDGVYQPSQSSQLYDLADVESIEVLKGPQGSLYGQNAAGGAIIINTMRPSFTPTGKISLSYGNLNDRNVRGFVSGPLGSTVAVSLSGAYQERDGYNDNIVTGGHDAGLESKVVRGKVLWAPQEDVSIMLTGYWFDRSDTSLFSGQPLQGNSLAYQFAPDAPKPTKPWQYALNPAYGYEPVTILRGHGASLVGEFDTDLGMFRSVSAFTSASPVHYVDYDYTSVPLSTTRPAVPVRAFTQELSFTSTQLGAWNYTAGLFYLNSKERFANNLFGFFDPFPTPFSVRQNGTNTKNSAAAFAEVGYAFTDRWSMIAGLRYSYETQLASFGMGDAPEQTSPRGTVSFHKTTPRVSLRYALDEASNVYVTYSQGFKSGLVDIQNLHLPPVDPEIVTAYEVGYKGRIFDTVQLGLAAFRYDYEDIQVQVQIGPGLYAYQNAAQSKIDGFEGSLDFELFENFRVGAAVSYLDGKYERFPNATVQVPNPGGGNTTASRDVSGNRLIRTPEWTGNLNVNYAREFSSGALSMYAGLYHSEGFFFEASNRVKQDSHALIDAEISFAPAGSGMRFALWGRNLGDEAVLQSFLPTDVVDGVSFAAPRTYGLRADYSF